MGFGLARKMSAGQWYHFPDSSWARLMHELARDDQLAGSGGMYDWHKQLNQRKGRKNRRVVDVKRRLSCHVIGVISLSERGHMLSIGWGCLRICMNVCVCVCTYICMHKRPRQC